MSLWRGPAREPAAVPHWQTEAPRGAPRAQRLTEPREARRRERAQVQARERADARATRSRRREAMGARAGAAGLLVWEDGTRAGLCQRPALRQDTPAPVAVLAGLLTSPGSRDAVSVGGMAPCSAWGGP